MIQQFCAYSNLFIFATSFLFGIFVLSHKPKKEVNQTFSAFCFFVAIWTLGYFLWATAKSKESALYYVRFYMISVNFIPTIFFHFSTVFTDTRHRHKRALFLCYLFSLIYIPISLTPYYAPSVRDKFWYHWTWVPDAGPLLHPFVAYFFITVLYSHLLLYRSYKLATDPIKKKQIKLVLLGTAIAFPAGSLNWCMWYNIPIPPVLNVLITCYIAFVAYAIMNYRLWDIELVIRKAFILSGLFAVLFGSTLFLGLLLQSAFFQKIGFPQWLSLALAVMFIMLVYEPIKSKLVHWTNHYLFQQKYDYKKVIQHFSEKVSTILIFDELIRVTENTLRNSFQAEQVTFSLVSKTDPFRDVFETTQNILIKNDLKKINQSNGYELVIPLFYKKEYLGWLGLGPRRSGELYYEDDIELLATLSGQLGIAVQNTKLFDQSTRAQAEVAQASKMATVGTLAASINHEVRNPLYVAKGQLQSYLMKLKDEKNEWINENDSLEPVKEAADLMEASIRQIDRATSIMQSLSAFSKPSYQVNQENISLKLAVDNVLNLLSHEFKYNETQLQVDIPSDLPSLQMNPRHLEEILFNLLTNALHAVENKNGSRVTIKAHTSLFPFPGGEGLGEGERSTHPHLSSPLQGEAMRKVIIEISDTGSGISLDNLPKIWEPFFTTKGDKGTGLGLYVTKKLVEANQGTIEVISQINRGTTFKVVFPITSQMVPSTHNGN
jgi:signal transduction histidine kinase